MKKLYLVIFLLSVTVGISAQKMTIKTASGQTVEITCEGGVTPTEVVVVNDSIVFKMPAQTVQSVKEETSDSIIAEAVTENDVASVDTTEVDTTAVNLALTDSLSQNFTASSNQSAISFIANAIAEEANPEYAQLNREVESLPEPSSEKDVVKAFAKGFLDEETVETVDFFGSLLSGFRFTKDTTFVAEYEQRKSKKRWRAYNTVVIEGSFGQNIEGVSDAVASKVSEEDYGDDTKNEKKFGGGLCISRNYLRGSEVNGKWIPNPIGFALSWGGLVTYSYEQDMGSYVNAMGKLGIQVGNDIVIGVDGLLGCGITPYNTFYSNGVNHSVLNKSAFCLKYGVQGWACLNFSKNTYTTFYGRYICSVKPSSAFTNLPDNWEVIVEDFDPSSWTVGLGVGFKFGAPEEPSQDKRLRASLNTGYRFIGKQKGMLLSAEFERFTQVSYSTTLSCGLAVERLANDEDDKDHFTSVLFTGGFKVKQPSNNWFWGAKLYGGIGDYDVIFSGKIRNAQLTSSTKKLCGIAALQIEGGLKLGKCSEAFAALRPGYHFGKAIEMEGFDGSSYENLKGFEMDARLGYRFTF